MIVEQGLCAASFLYEIDVPSVRAYIVGLDLFLHKVMTIALKMVNDHSFSHQYDLTRRHNEIA